jgi:Domain of unknown function (DUF4397)
MSLRPTFPALVGLALALAACGTESAPDPLQPTGPTGRMRVVNVITDTTRGRVNVIVDGLAFGVNLTYTQSTPATLPAPSTAPYAAVLAGNRPMVLKRTVDTATTVGTFSVAMGASEDRTVYVIGGAGGSPIAIFSTADTNTAPAAGQVRLRIAQMSPTAGALDVFVTAPGADLTTATPVAANLAYQRASAYFSVPAGTYRVRAVPAGTAPANRPTSVVIDLNNIALAAGAARTIVTADNNTGGAPLRAFLLVDR